MNVINHVYTYTYIYIYVYIYIYTYARTYMYVYVSDNHILLPNILTYSGYKIYMVSFFASRCSNLCFLQFRPWGNVQWSWLVIARLGGPEQKKTNFGFSDVFIIVNGFQLFPTRKKIHVILYHMMKWFRILFPPRILN